MKQEIYLDNHSASRPCEKVIASMMPFFTQKWGVYTAPHQRGQNLYSDVLKSYEAIYSFFKAKEEDTFILTSSVAEAINHVISSVYKDITLQTGKNQFIVSSIAEAPTLLAASSLETFDCVVKKAKPNEQGIIDAQAIIDVLSPRTALVSLSWADGLTGVVYPIYEIGDLLKERGILFHLDVTYSLGKMDFDWHDSGVDILTFNGTQIHAPLGIGGLFVKEGVFLSPLIQGGLEQAGKRGGELNIPYLCALAEAFNQLKDASDHMCIEVARLRNLFEESLLKEIPEIDIHFKDSERIPNCSCISFPHVANEAFLFLLNQEKLFACIGGGSFQQISLVLKECGVSPSLANSAISFSLSRETKEDEIKIAVDTIVKCYKKAKKLAEHIL